MEDQTALLEPTDKPVDTTKKSSPVYKWKPDWHHLDDDDLIYWFCSLTIKIIKKQYDDRELHPRLKRLFAKKGRAYIFQGNIDTLEIDDVVQLTAFLKISVPRDIMEQSITPMRPAMHFEWNEDKSVFEFDPVVKYLDFYDVPFIVSLYDQQISEEEYRKLPSRMRTFYRKVEAGTKKGQL